jgi:hypothetical protein
MKWTARPTKRQERKKSRFFQNYYFISNKTMSLDMRPGHELTTSQINVALSHAIEVHCTATLVVAVHCAGLQR